MGRVKLSAADLEGAAFDEDPAPGPAAPAGRVKLSAADLEGATFDEGPAKAESPARPGVAKAVAHGAAQGGTFGFFDEVMGVAGMALGVDYKRVRDHYRDEGKAAQAAHPGAYLAGEVGGGIATSLLPGGGAVAAGKALAGGGKLAQAAAKVGAHAAGRGAISGAAYGAGSSEADSAAGLAMDAAKGGAFGAATGYGLNKIVSGATGRAEKRLVGTITEGVPANMRDRLVGARGKKTTEIIDAISDDPDLLRAVKQKAAPTEMLERVDTHVAREGARLTELYAKAMGKVDGIATDAVVERVSRVMKGMENQPGKKNLRDAVQGTVDNIIGYWGQRKHVSIEDVRILAGDIADTAFQGSPANPTGRKASLETTQAVWRQLKGLIDEAVDEAGKAGAGKGVDSTSLRALNQRMGTLMNMRDALTYRATREATPSTRLGAVLGGAVDIGIGASSLTALAGKKAIEHIGIPAARAADYKLAQLVQAAKNGSRGADLAQRATELGLARGIATSLDAWITQQAGGGRAQPFEER